MGLCKCCKLARRKLDEVSPLRYEGLRLGAWAAAQGFAFSEHARALPPTESSSLPEPHGSVY